MKEKQKLITVGRFDGGFEAELAKISLENEGITAVVVGGDLLTALPAIYGICIQLQVFEEDEQRARQILDRIESPDGEDQGLE